MRKIVFVFFVYAFVISAVGGCKAFEAYQDSAGVSHTLAGDYLDTASDVTKTVGSFVPGYGLVGGGVALLLSLIGNGITSVAVRRKSVANNKLAMALEVVAKGVNTATDNYADLKVAITDILKGIGDDDAADKVEKVFADNGEIKNIIQKYATDKNIDSFLKMFVKTAEATGRA